MVRSEVKLNKTTGSTFEFLKRCQLVTRKGVNIPFIDSLSAKQIVKTAEALLVLTESKQPRASQNIFSHRASISLGGGRGGCEFIQCRLNKIDELSRFAVMYSDCVYIDNFFNDYENLKYRGVDELKQALTIDIFLLTIIRPLLENGFVKFYMPDIHSCTNCYNVIYDNATKKRVDEGYKQLSGEYLANSTASLIHFDKRLLKLSYSGSETYYEHGGLVHTIFPKHKTYKLLSSKPRILSRLKRDGQVELSQSLMKQIGFHKRLAASTVDSAILSIISAKILNTFYLTDNPLDISFLQSVSNDPRTDERNSIALKRLTSIVPFVGDVSIPDVIKIRQREEEAFIKYRRALNVAIDEFKSNKSTFTEKEARALYSDVIAPRLATLERSVKLAKRDLVKKASRSVVAVVGAISFGLYTGFIPKEFAELAKAVGLTTIATNLIEKILPLGDSVNSIKNDDLYFLWKAKKLSK